MSTTPTAGIYTCARLPIVPFMFCSGSSETETIFLRAYYQGNQTAWKCAPQPQKKPPSKKIVYCTCTYDFLAEILGMAPKMTKETNKTGKTPCRFRGGASGNRALNRLETIDLAHCLWALPSCLVPVVWLPVFDNRYSKSFPWCPFFLKMQRQKRVSKQFFSNNKYKFRRNRSGIWFLKRKRKERDWYIISHLKYSP